MRRALGRLPGVVPLPLMGICLLALALRLSVAWSFPNVHFADEIFQSLEQSHRLAFGHGIVPWEFQEGIRSWLIPGALALVMMTFGSAYLAGAQAALAAFSLSPVVVGYFWGRRLFNQAGAVLMASLLAVWFELVFFAAKGLSEVIAANFLVIGLFFLAGPDSREATKGRALLGGMAVALAVALRIQLLPAVLPIAAFVFYKSRNWRSAVLGALIATISVGLLDWATWGRPFQSIWLNVWLNLVEGRSELFGTRSNLFYAAKMYRHWNWALLPMTFFAVRGMKKLPIVAGVAAIILISHSLIPHKEYRFMYPAIPLIAMLVGAGCAQWLTATNAAGAKAASTRLGFVVAGWAVISLALATTGQFAAFWSTNRGFLMAARELRLAQDACGIGVRVHWAHTEGYTHVHRNIPIYSVRSPQALQRLTPAVNYVLQRSDAMEGGTPFSVLKCWAQDGHHGPLVCLFRREGSCSVSPADQIVRPAFGTR